MSQYESPPPGKRLFVVYDRVEDSYLGNSPKTTAWFATKEDAKRFRDLHAQSVHGSKPPLRPRFVVHIGPDHHKFTGKVSPLNGLFGERRRVNSTHNSK